MNQLQAFIEKARSDSALMAKIDTLGVSDAEPDKVAALAAEYGFSVTEEDCRKAAETACPHRAGELAEEELDAVAGGATENRYDPGVCSQYKEAHYNCVGFLGLFWCDHYSEITVSSSLRRIKCNMGQFEYEVQSTGKNQRF